MNKESLRLVYKVNEEIDRPCDVYEATSPKGELISVPILKHHQDVDMLRAWHAISNVMQENSLISGKWRVLGKKVKYNKVHSVLEEKGGPTFDIQSEYFDFWYLAREEETRILIENKDPEHQIPWGQWINSFFKHLNQKLFLQAWVFDDKYDEWQNVEDIMIYECEDRPYTHLPMKSNGWPPPLEEQIIDISNNPGRKLFKEGYVEGIGSTMWLGDGFWDIVGRQRKEDILAAPWAKTEALEDGILKIEVLPTCFVDDSTADLQRKLRKTLYGVD